MATITMQCEPVQVSTMTLKTEPEPSPLLDLPLDIMFEIVDLLPLHSKVIFSQTCSDLRAVVKNETAQKLLSAPRAERVSYLRLREKAMPHYRLCYMCMRLHKLEV
ncbi:hypothetical protein NA57DRAFT_57830 [Rhizodiscina lignyota]|uniref:F-box domain-containing protein n=1 Tax=Rhizodiscina lignyota TaxID=1504668 RepID=A0A9P4IC04_9PEZI|nr:hypothetical protein NA57DRAFT_57830 [Rhizodiscina lignyota]